MIPVEMILLIHQKGKEKKKDDIAHYQKHIHTKIMKKNIQLNFLFSVKYLFEVNGGTCGMFPGIQQFIYKL